MLTQSLSPLPPPRGRSFSHHDDPAPLARAHTARAGAVGARHRPSHRARAGQQRKRRQQKRSRQEEERRASEAEGEGGQGPGADGAVLEDVQRGAVDRGGPREGFQRGFATGGFFPRWWFVGFVDLGSRGGLAAAQPGRGQRHVGKARSRVSLKAPQMVIHHCVFLAGAAALTT